MKRFIHLASGLFLLGLASSCTVTTLHVNTNPVGSEVGKAKGHNFQKDVDYSVGTAAKKGGVQEIGVIEIKSKVILFYVQVETTVSGK